MSRRLDLALFSMLLVGLSFACYAPSLDTPQEQAYRAAVVIEGEVFALPENVSVEPYSVNVRVLDVWPVNGGGLEREQLVTVGDFGSEAPCVLVEKDHRYIFFMDPTEEPLVFKASFAPVDANERNLKKEVESILCEDCASPPKLRPIRGQSLAEGERLQLRCEVTDGNPSPAFRWYKDGSELKKSRDIKIKSNKKSSKMQISRVRLEDAGNYSCVVENILGRDNASSTVSVHTLTTTLSPASSHTRQCNETEKSYCVNGGDCYVIHGINQLSCKCPNDYTGDRCQQSVMADFYKHLGIEFMEAEELYQKRVLTITGICVALLVVGIVCVVAYCKTKKQRKKMQQHMHQNMCAEPNRRLANGPNHPGPAPEEIPMVDYISKNVPATERVTRHGTETSGNFSGSRMSSRSHHSSTASHASSHRHEERTWSMERSDSMNSDCHSGALSSSVGTSKCSSPACMARRAAAHCSLDSPGRPRLSYGDSYDSLRDSPHSDRYVSALTTPARLSPVEFGQVPTFQITTPNASHALSLPPAAAAAMANYAVADDDQPLLRHYHRSRRPCYPAESTGSLPSSPYRLVDDDAYETTQEYAGGRDRYRRTSRRPRRSRNSHATHSSHSNLSDSEWDEEYGLGGAELGHGESTPFLSALNMSSPSPEPATIYRPTHTPTHTPCLAPLPRRMHGKLTQPRGRPDNAPL
ncbi:neuregulin 2b isoform X2 [Alosa sapidissima]|uniref:neuregulin 2b isoform X2 n=1 Tax=Alosa sapidissima TaxID=34773 RepID=UPI001C084A16|nr:neuregulin 2b isoform X2 [Alosa sapidissima]